mmetsp:Transcript_20217/g.44008  ORF Transcript_20217/g.44008 Transcript_20217/m.44008 type:complete len:131 (-) Transcript_20217:540-932(-)
MILECCVQNFYVYTKDSITIRLGSFPERIEDFVRDLSAMNSLNGYSKIDETGCRSSDNTYGIVGKFLLDLIRYSMRGSRKGDHSNNGPSHCKDTAHGDNIYAYFRYYKRQEPKWQPENEKQELSSHEDEN